MKKSKNVDRIIKKINNIHVQVNENYANVTFEHPQYEGLSFEMETGRFGTNFGWKVSDGLSEEKKCLLSERKKQYASKWIEMYKHDFIHYFKEVCDETKMKLLMGKTFK